MTDIRADEATPLDDEDRLPWLEAVDEEGDSDGPSPLKLIVAVLIGLVAIGGIVGGLFWMGNRDVTEKRDSELIAAPEGDYKVKPDDPGGLNVQGEGDTAFAASEGADPNGTINTDALPETPVAPAPTPKVAPTPAPAAKPAPAPAPEPSRTPVAGGVTIQLGAFSSAPGANNAWKALASRFTYLAPLSHSVIPTNNGGRTLYRLRASGSDAKGICNRLRVAGEACTIVD